MIRRQLPLVFCMLLLISCNGRIDREALVRRNSVHITSIDTLGSLTVGNGGLLTAVAMMCAGYDGCRQKNPGFPKDGRWRVRWEGLFPLP